MRKSKLNEFLTNTGFFKGVGMGLLLLFIILVIQSYFYIDYRFIVAILFLSAIVVFFLTRYYERKNKLIEGEQDDNKS